VQARVEDYHADSRFDLIVSRAYASIADFVATVDHLWQPETRLMIMKTQMSGDERRGLDETLFELNTLPLEVPGIRETRSLVTVKRRKS
jgi:16S rRNA (guanine527-N7)-methyltransferase